MVRWLVRLQFPESKLPMQVLWFARCCYQFLSSADAVSTDEKKRARFVGAEPLGVTLIIFFRSEIIF